MDFQKIELSKIHPDSMNPRKTFDEGELLELADNIEHQGLLQPITIRPCGISAADHKTVIDYKIVCGERRYRAMKILCARHPDDEKYDYIQAIVRDMTDDEAFEAMITENLQRKGVDPMDEAFAFGQLAERGNTAEEIAARFGKTIRFVQDRVKLNKLVPELALAVRDGKCPISAAMLICKLDDEHQRRYFSNYENIGFSKVNAQSFVNALFMNIDQSLWAKKDQREFTGGCGKACFDCQFNTANHGCLFYEMNNTQARCTDRKKFEEKAFAFLLDEIDRRKDTLVKKGEPLTKGKCVVGIVYDCDGKEASNLRKRVMEELDKRGILCVDPSQTFKSRCWYDFNDERVKQFLDNGEGYHVFVPVQYSSVSLLDQCWYVKNDEEGNKQEFGLPVEVQTLRNKLNNEMLNYRSSLTFACVKAMTKATEKSEPDATPLTTTEKKLFLRFLLNEYEVKTRLTSAYGSTPIADIADSNLDNPDALLRMWIQSNLDINHHAEMHLAEPFLDEIGRQWCGEAYDKAKESAIQKHEKTVAKLTEELAKLGYDKDGKPLKKEPDFREQYEELKKKHPGTILLFRIGDFYEAYFEDGEKASEILELALTKRKDGIPYIAFPHKALETYLPRLVRSGNRVGICEELNDPKKNEPCRRG